GLSTSVPSQGASITQKARGGLDLVKTGPLFGHKSAVLNGTSGSVFLGGQVEQVGAQFTQLGVFPLPEVPFPAVLVYRVYSRKRGIDALSVPIEKSSDLLSYRVISGPYAVNKCI